MSPAPALLASLSHHGQEHLLKWWGDLDESERARLVAEIEAIDFDQLDRLIAALIEHDAPASPAPERVGPIEVFRLPQTDGERITRRHAAELGAAALAAGEVA